MNFRVSVGWIIALGFWCQTVNAEVTNITNAELLALGDSNLTIIDVRRIDEWTKTGVIEGSHPITFFDRHGRYDVKDWLSQVEAIVARDQPIALICARGVRSSKIADLLDAKLGFSQVYNVTEGMVLWSQEGWPTVEWKSNEP